MISSAAAVVILFAQSALGYSLCTNAPFPYDGTDMAPIPIVQTQESANGAPFKVSGFIKITDKCGFQTQNFTLTGLGAGVVATWFGSFPGDPAGVSLTEKTPVQANAENAVSQNFEFTKRAGASISYNDFTEFRLFVESSNTLLANAVIANSTVQRPTTPTMVNPMVRSTMAVPSPTSAAVRPSVSPQQQSGASESSAAVSLFAVIAAIAFF